MKAGSRIMLSWVGILVVVLNAGCLQLPEPIHAAHSTAWQPEIVARFTDDPIVLDGKLDDVAWTHASVYPLYMTDAETRSGKNVEELSYAMFAWDNRYFYAAVSCEDSDVVAEAEADQEAHWKLGDTVELFIKPSSSTWYWELYGTPAGKKANYFIPGRGRLWLDSFMDYECAFKVAAYIEGSLNEWRDTDKGWAVEMAMPIEALVEQGDPFGEGEAWTALITRVNYSRTIPRMEMSSWPPLPKRDYHLIEHYAPLHLVKE